jgi:hypothetical protein
LGYARNSSLLLSAGTEEEAISEPSEARTTTSFHPILEAKFVS